LSAEFSFDPESTAAESQPAKPESPEDKARWERIMKLLLKPEEHDRLEGLLLARLKERRTQLDELWTELNGHWGYEDGFYRFYHGSFKVYGVQRSTARAVAFLAALLPERELNDSFTAIVRDGTGKEFDLSHNAEWEKHTRPILEAFAHARFMVEMCVRYAHLETPPRPLPSGYAALLYLYNLR
jgi:hypothetical protein